MSFEDFMKGCSTATEEQIQEYVKINKKNIKRIDKTIKKVRERKGTK